MAVGYVKTWSSGAKARSETGIRNQGSQTNPSGTSKLHGWIEEMEPTWWQGWGAGRRAEVSQEPGTIKSQERGPISTSKGAKDQVKRGLNKRGFSGVSQ